MNINFKKQVLVFIMLLLAFNFSKAQETNASKEELQSLKMQFENSKTALQKVKSLLPLLSHYRRQRDFNTADSLLKLGMSIAEKDGDKLAVIYAHFNYYTISFFGLSAEQKIEMMSKMQAGLKLAQDGNFKNEETLILSRIAHKYAFYDLNFEKAISYFNMADLNDEKVSDSARSDFYIYKSLYYSRKKENLEMFKCNLNALKYAEKCRSVYYLTRAYRTLGVFYKEIDNFEKAMYWHKKEYDLHTANQYKRGINNTNFIIARSYRDWGKNNEAIERYSTVIAESIKINDRPNKDMATGELFNLYLRLGKIKQADSLNEKYQIIERNLTNKDYFTYNWSKGEYFSFFNADSAKHYYNNAVSLIDSSKSLSIKISLYTDLAIALRKTGEAQKALSFVQKALAMNNELKLLSYYPEIYQEMDSAYQELGDFKNAYTARGHFLVYQDSIDALNDKTQAMKLEINAEEENQKKLEEDRLKATANKHNIQYTAIAIGGLILIISLLMLSFFHTPKWLVRILGFVSFIFLFEFLILVLDTRIHHWAHGAPLPILIIKFCIACMLVPLHHWLEHKVIHFLYEKKLQLKAVKKEEIIAEG